MHPRKPAAVGDSGQERAPDGLAGSPVRCDAAGNTKEEAVVGDVRQFPGGGQMPPPLDVAGEAEKADLHRVMTDQLAIDEELSTLRNSVRIIREVPWNKWGPLQHKVSFVAIWAATAVAREAVTLAANLWVLAPEPLPDIKPPADPREFFTGQDDGDERR